MLTIIGATHRGKRQHNEDCFVVDPQVGFGLIADGMGGYACGEVASELVKQTVYEAVLKNEGLSEGIIRAHHLITTEASEDGNKKGMGSTVVAVKFQGTQYQIAWVGDSRAYLWLASEGELRQISRDHSYVESLISSGTISENDAINHPNRNLITQAVGAAGDEGLEIDVVEGRLGDGHQLILCSDGLVDELVDIEIARLIAKANSPSEAVKSLVDSAVNAGGRDNITVVIASVDDVIENLQTVIPKSVRSTWLDRANQGAGDRVLEQERATNLAMGKQEDSDSTLSPLVGNIKIIWHALTQFIKSK